LTRQSLVLLLLFEFLQARAQDAHRLLAILYLRLLVLHRDDESGRQVRDANRRVGRVDALSAGARRAEGVYAQVVRVDLHVNLFGFGEHGDGDGGGVYAPARLCLRHALDAVYAGLVLESGVDLVAFDECDGLLDAAYARLRRVEYLHAPALSLGVATVHPKHLRGEERRFVAAPSGAYFEDHVLLVVGVAREKEYAQVFPGLFELGFERRRLHAREFAHLLVVR